MAGRDTEGVELVDLTDFGALKGGGYQPQDPNTVQHNRRLFISEYIWGQPVLDNGTRLNPLHLAIGTRGYHIQSMILRIPDRFGFFSPGAPSLHAQQGYAFWSWIAGPLLLSLGLAGTLAWKFYPQRHYRHPLWALLIYLPCASVVAFRESRIYTRLHAGHGSVQGAD